MKALFIMLSVMILALLSAGCSSSAKHQTAREQGDHRFPAASQGSEIFKRAQRYLSSPKQSLTSLPQACLSYFEDSPTSLEVRENHDDPATCPGGDTGISHLVAVFTLKDSKLYYLDIASDQQVLAIEEPVNGGLYVNERFEFSLSYPANLFRAPVESTNSDGAAIESLDRAAMIKVYGSYTPSVLDVNLRQMYQQEVKTPGRHVIYKTLNAGKKFFVVSGTVAGKIFYIKTFVMGGTQKTFEITYDQEKKATYDALTRELVRNFRPR